MKSTYLDSLISEFRRHKHLGEAALRQIPDVDLNREFVGDGNSVATIVRHISGNLLSRFTDFLTTDGEKPWRKRDREFDELQRNREEIIELWDKGWTVLLDCLNSLSEPDLEKTITIRGVELSVIEALNRSLAHISYHVGQVVLLVRMSVGDKWISSTVSRGQTEAYNKNPRLERFEK